MLTWGDFHRHDRLHEYIVVGLMQQQQQQHTKVATSELADVGCQDVMAHTNALAKKGRGQSYGPNLVIPSLFLNDDPKSGQIIYCE